MPTTIQPQVCRVKMSIQCEGGFLEVLPHDGERTKSRLRDLVNQNLQEFFDMVMSSTVIVHLSPDELACSLQVEAECLSIYFPSDGTLKMELALENKMGCALLELFEVVSIEDVSITRLSPLGA